MKLVPSAARHVFPRDALPSSLKHLPRFAKYILYLLLFINLRSLPFSWHLRVFRPVISIRLSYVRLKLRSLFLSRERREKEKDEWLDNLCPVGQDPLTSYIPYYSWASFDDSDFNGHLSNSSYAKACDAARIRAALKMFPMFFSVGGKMALAATYFDFIREIPMLAPYEVRVGLGAWDQKWLYVVCKFVTKPKKGSKPEHATKTRPDSFAGINAVVEDESSSSTGTPVGSDPLSNVNGSTSLTITEEDVAAISNELNSHPNMNGKPRKAKVLYEPDGAILHAVAISQGCFKIGRITVPPALILAVNGSSVPPAEQGVQYSLKNPPPTWWKAKELMSKLHGGSPRRLREFFEGGWREVQDKWWEDALGGSIEERRKRGLESMSKLRTGIESVR